MFVQSTQAHLCVRTLRWHPSDRIGMIGVAGSAIERSAPSLLEGCWKKGVSPAALGGGSCRDHQQRFPIRERVPAAHALVGTGLISIWIGRLRLAHGA